MEVMTNFLFKLLSLVNTVFHLTKLKTIERCNGVGMSVCTRLRKNSLMY